MWYVICQKHCMVCFLISSTLCAVFGPSSKNKKKSPPAPPPHPKKKSLYFEKWNFLALILKNFLSFLIFWDMEFFSPSSKNKKNLHRENSLYFDKWNFLIFLIWKFLIFSQKKAFLIFQETETRKNSLYLSKQNFLTFL